MLQFYWKSFNIALKVIWRDFYFIVQLKLLDTKLEDEHQCFSSISLRGVEMAYC